MVRKQLEDFLRDHGVEIVTAEGNPFDPNFMTLLRMSRIRSH